jgi:hypothetical protein
MKRRALWLLFLLPFLTSCWERSNDVTPEEADPYVIGGVKYEEVRSDKWWQPYDLQDRQGEVLSPSFYLPVDIDAIVEVVININEDLDYWWDEHNRWCTVEETEEQGYADCMDYAWREMVLLVRTGYPRENLFILCTQRIDGNGDLRGHASLGVYPDASDHGFFYSVGYLGEVTASPSIAVTPVLGFNLDSVWDYVPVT